VFKAHVNSKGGAVAKAPNDVRASVAGAFITRVLLHVKTIGCCRHSVLASKILFNT
jgi:hypothetical protein